MSNPKECIICSREADEGEFLVETDDGFICHECLIDMKEIKKDHYGIFGEEEVG